MGIDIGNYDPHWMEKQVRSHLPFDFESRTDALIAARNAARAAKNFKEADRIRDELEAMGITLKDAKDPKTGELVTTWEVAR
jgi:cysteinyl-tRNA synthetase